MTSNSNIHRRAFVQVVVQSYFSVALLSFVPSVIVQFLFTLFIYSLAFCMRERKHFVTVITNATKK